MRSILRSAVVVAVLSATLALDETKTATAAAPPVTVRKTVGGFYGIGNRQPAVETCVLSGKGGRKVRTLPLKGGGTIVEEQVARDEKTTAYTYALQESPLPVEGYGSTLSLATDGKGSKLIWMGSFKAKGAPEAKAEEIVGGICDGGLKGITDKAR